MKVIYCCECCGEITDQVDTPEDSGPEDILTDNGEYDIISMQSNPSRIYKKSMCEECLATLGDEKDLRLYTPMFH
ncbi:MAG: DUF2757 family protein [Clostridia bacterium]|nr:DUF2757 family protein [Clostridia bacterium]